MIHVCLVPMAAVKRDVRVPSTGVTGVDRHLVGAGSQISSSASETKASDY